MAYTTLAQGSSVVIAMNDQFDGLEVINRPQDLAQVALTSGAWSYGATPQQHSGRRVYSLNGAGSITITATSGSLQYEYTNASDNTAPFTLAQVAAIQALVSAYGTAVVEVTPYVQRTSTGTVFTGLCEYAGYDVVAVTASPTITVYDGVDTSGTLILAATVMTVGRFERTFKLAFTVGCHVVISGTATVNVLAG